MQKCQKKKVSYPQAFILGLQHVLAIADLLSLTRIIQGIHIDDRNMMVIGIPIFLTIAAIMLPKEVLAHMPDRADYILSSGITVGALTTVLLNLTRIIHE